MKTKDELKEIVKERYTDIAMGQDTAVSSCGCGCGSTKSKLTEFTDFSDDYSQLEGYVPEADMNLGCGMPTEFADIKAGDHVLDLGSGAGNDCFVARAITGESGKVSGIDFTDIMIAKARLNAIKLGYNNVEFVKGDIEDMPLPDAAYDKVISNCVLNLVPDKTKAFSEIFRVMKPGGHFCISDVVLRGTLSPSIESSAAMYAGCVSGALQQDDYLEVIRKAGFRNIAIAKVREEIIPFEVLESIATVEEIEKMKTEKSGIFSITVTGDK